MKNLKKDLKAVNREIKALSKKVDGMVAAVNRLEKAKGKAAKAKPAKRTAAKKPAVKKTMKMTAADAVFNVIKRYKKGVNTATLMERSGFAEKKIYNIIYKLKKQGKIKNVAKGVYLKT